MERAKLNNNELTDIILYSLKKNAIDINSIDQNEIKNIIEKYTELCNDFENKYIQGKLDTFKRAACLLVTINKNKFLYDKKINASIALDAAYKMCEKPYWNVGENYDIPEKMEEVDLDKAFENNVETYNKSKEMLIDSLVFEESTSPMSYWLNLYTFYYLALQLKHNNVKIEPIDYDEDKVTEENRKLSWRTKILSIFKRQ